MSNKVRHHIYFSEENYQRAEALYKAYGCKSVSDLVDTALEFYLAHRETEDVQHILSEELVAAIGSAVKLTEDRLSRLLFKIAVEDAMLKNIMAAACDVTPDTLDAIRGRCVQEVRELNGIVDLKNVAAYQREKK